MPLLSERQQTAAALCREIQRMGGHVVNPMPLRDGEQLRFHVPSASRNQILEKMSSWNWSPQFCGMTTHYVSGSYAVDSLCSVYEIDLGKEATPIPTERGTREIPREVREFSKLWGRK
jgi:hypothetical protein